MTPAKKTGVTPVSNFRIPPELKKDFKEITVALGDDMTNVVVDSIQAYVKKNQRHLKAATPITALVKYDEENEGEVAK